MSMKVPDCTPDGRFSIDTSKAGRLGEGAFGVCCLGFHTITHNPVAIKISKRMDVAALEAIVQKRLKHPNVVQLYSAQVSMKDPGVSYLVMECCTGGELFNVIAEQGALHPDTAFHFFCEIISGLAYCHKSGVYHRDLKPENILLSHNGHARIADFGLAMLDQKQGEPVFANSCCGSIYYMAPEVVNQRQGGYDPAAADIWSLGIIYCTMLTGCAPWIKASKSCLEFLHFCSHGLWLPSFVPEGAAEIVRRMLDINTITRATASEVEGMAQRLVAAHAFRSLVPSISNNKASCCSHLYETGIDIPGKVTIADVECLCLHRTKALLGDRYNSTCSFSTLCRTPDDKLSNTETRVLLSPNRRSTAQDPLPSLPGPLQTVPLLGEQDGRLYERPQSLLPQTSRHDRPRRWSSTLHEALMALPWQLSEDSRNSQTTSPSGSGDWYQGDRSSRQGNDSPELPQAALCQLSKQKQKPAPTEQKMLSGTEKAKLGSLRISVEEEGMNDLARFASPSEDVGFGSGETGSAWSNASGLATSSSFSSLSFCQIEDIDSSFAEIHAIQDVQNQSSSSAARGKHAWSNTLPFIVRSKRVPPPSPILKADELPELQSPAESPASSRTLLNNQRSQVPQSLLRHLEVFGLGDVAKPLVLQAPPLPKPWSLQRHTAEVAGPSLPSKFSYTNRRLQKKAKGGGETCVNYHQRRLIWSDGGACMHGESGSGTCARCQEAREATATGAGRRRSSRSPSPLGYWARDTTHMVLSADSLASVAVPEQEDKGWEEDQWERET